LFATWKRVALDLDPSRTFEEMARQADVESAIGEIDRLVGGLFDQYFGDAEDPIVKADYLSAMLAFATDSLPPASERYELVPAGDPRKRTAGRHTLDGDLMWFVWAAQLDASTVCARGDRERARRNLLMAGVVAGCSANFAWRGHRYTRSEYVTDRDATDLITRRFQAWTDDFTAAALEMRMLYRIREWGPDAASGRQGI
jgi:hypothetical protein